MRTTEDYRQLMDLSDRDLFGNPAGEDEDPSVLASYFVDRQDLQGLSDHALPFGIVHARKGMGKSAFLSHLRYRYSQAPDPPVTIHITGADLAGDTRRPTLDSHTMISDWQRVMCARVNAELGRLIGLALDETSIAMVEESELSGLRERNFLGALLDRLESRLPLVGLKKPTPTDPLQLLKRFSHRYSGRSIWLFIDDIDATFRRGERESLQLSTFFSAARLLSHSVQGLRIRVAVRSDVWYHLRARDEALDKCAQYLFDLHWRPSGIRSILAQRVYAYLLRRGRLDRDDEQGSDERALDRDRWNRRFLEVILPRDEGWSGTSSYSYINRISGLRPRWVVELFRTAVRRMTPGAQRVGIGDLKRVMSEFSHERLLDYFAENRGACPMIERLVGALSGGSHSYTTEELIEVLRPLTESGVQLESVPVTDPFELGGFLFRTHFLLVRSQNLEAREARQYLSFDDAPHFASFPRLGGDHRWEIDFPFQPSLSLESMHPFFRNLVD